MYFCFNPFPVWPRFYDVPLYFNAHAFTCMYNYVHEHVHNVIFVDARALCKCIFRWLPRSKCFSGNKYMLFVHHMHTLICRVVKWNYEQHLFGNTFLPTDIRFAPANAPLNFRLRKVKLSRHMQYRRLDMFFACGTRHLCSESGHHHLISEMNNPLLHVRLINKVK